MIYLPAAWWITYNTLRRHRRHPLLTRQQRRLRIHGTAALCGIAVLLCWYPAAFCFGTIAALLADVPWDLTQLADGLTASQIRTIYVSMTAGILAVDLAGIYVLRRLLRWLIPEASP